jgi:hypothetical protein
MTAYVVQRTTLVRAEDRRKLEVVSRTYHDGSACTTHRRTSHQKGPSTLFGTVSFGETSEKS